MTRRQNLVSEQDDTAQEPLTSTGDTGGETYETSEQEVFEEEYWEDKSSRPRGKWIVPALTIIVALAWTGFFGWVNHQEMLSGAAPGQWIDWIVQWSIPLVLLVTLYLHAMRNSRREASRFTDAARALAQESAQLETRLVVVNRELSLARDFIESQSRDLESLGRQASERLSTNADRLQALIHDNSAQLNNIGRVSESAVGNMEVLREQLPVIANSARDVGNQFGRAGQNAQEQADTLVSAFEKLKDFGEVSEGHVRRLQMRVEQTLDAFNQDLSAIEAQTGARFETLRSESERFREELKQSEEHIFDAIAARSEALTRQLSDDVDAMRTREAAAAAAMRERLVSLRVEGEKLVAKMDDGQAEAAQRWSAAIDGLEDRMRQVLEGIIKLDESATTNARMRLVALNEEATKVDDRLNEAMANFEDKFAQRREANDNAQQESLAALEQRIAEFDEQVTARQEEHLAHVAGLTERGEALAARMASLDEQLAGLGAQTEDTGGKISEAADTLANRLSQSRAVLDESGEFLSRLTDDSVRLLEIIRSSADYSQGALSDAVCNAEERLSAFGNTAKELHGLIEDAESRGTNLATQLDKTRETGTASLEQLSDLESQLGNVTSATEALAERTSQELREAIDLLSQASATVLESLRGEQTQAVTDLAEKVAETSREKLAESMRRHAAETIAELQQATARADDAGRETADRLRDEIARINDLASNLEKRVDYAREQAEEQVDNDFARRTALITEALNSSAIDIAKAFDNDIGDTQWSHYLRGDRGIFSRRAVRLLDKHESRQISAVYSEDAEFREVVNRYIHDFEAMLRGILSTRDGNAMAVTLLSSDIGKLYVALAQAIDRLRD